VIIFAFFAVYLIRILGGISAPPQDGIPVNLLVLMGISVAVPVASHTISSYMHSSPGTLTKERPLKNKMPEFADMLKEYGKPTLTRVQMFGWTWIGIIIYLSTFFSYVLSTSATVKNLTLPDIDTTLVILIGLSQAAYLAGKFVTVQNVEIKDAIMSINDDIAIISIFGSNFGSTIDTVWVNEHMIPREGILSWEDDRIIIRLAFNLFRELANYTIKIAKNSSVEKKNYVYRNRTLIDAKKYQSEDRREAIPE